MAATPSDPPTTQMTVIEQEAVWTDDRPTAPSTPSEPVASARQHRFLSRAAWREFALLAVVYELYTATRRISTGGADEAIANARHVLRLEHLAGLTPERWQPRRTSRDPQLEHPRPVRSHQPRHRKRVPAMNERQVARRHRSA
jgi:hypothetical protein